MSTISVAAGPFAHDRSSVNRIMLDVCLALAPATLFGLVMFGWPAINLWLVTCASALATEAVCLHLLGQPMRRLLDGSALLTGWLLAVSLPPWAPWWIGVGGSVFAIGIGKQLYGGIGQNIFNPAMLARVALLIAFPLQMTTWALPQPLFSASAPGFFDSLAITFAGAPLADGMTGATALGNLKTELTLNRTAEEILGESFNVISALFGSTPGSLGETSELLLLVGGVWLVLRRIIHWEIPVAMLASVFVMATFAYLIDPERYAGGLYHLTSGGLILCAFFIATDPVTSPISRVGRLIFGVSCGVLIYVIRAWGSFPEAAAFAVLFMNSLTPLIDRYWRPRAYGRNARGKPLVAAKWTSQVKEVDKV
ncbi:RnfABCDGE type electron transport complex subunit D [Azotobacter chroococcum]|uniref:Ion-translocating oxidoreductase complex subunit D n=1 Tax=Azotobacter chroococcum TaxID=353 RepID=A0AAQ0BZG6_9GAMM|nr:RnfABCDGE type electron transport complex subunit D [Azotobacter chroococcum]QQE88710.1 RnfABCDGE type electron transport complex subunit D [Azotobacter chroococcum]